MPLHAAETRARSRSSVAVAEVAIGARMLALVASLAFRPSERAVGTRAEVAAPARPVIEAPRTAGAEARTTREVLALAAAILARAARTAGPADAARPARATLTGATLAGAALARTAVAAVAGTAPRPGASMESSLVVMVWQIDFRS